MMTTNLCKKDSCPTCTEDAAWQALKKYPAPGWDNSKPVSTGDQTSINFAGLNGGTVSHIIDDGSKTLYNITHSDHIFSDGYVQRSVTLNGNMLQVKTIGEGITSDGSWFGIPRSVRATLNMKLYKPGFDSLDGKVKSEICK